MRLENFPQVTQLECGEAESWTWSARQGGRGQILPPFQLYFPNTLK